MFFPLVQWGIRDFFEILLKSVRILNRVTENKPFFYIWSTVHQMSEISQEVIAQYDQSKNFSLDSSSTWRNWKTSYQRSALWEGTDLSLPSPTCGSRLPEIQPNSSLIPFSPSLPSFSLAFATYGNLHSNRLDPNQIQATQKIATYWSVSYPKNIMYISDPFFSQVLNLGLGL